MVQEGVWTAGQRVLLPLVSLGGTWGAGPLRISCVLWMVGWGLGLGHSEHPSLVCWDGLPCQVDG